MSDEVVADHLIGVVFYFLRSVADFDSSLESGSEVAFASATGMHLTFQNQSSGRVQHFCCLLGVFSIQGNHSLLHSDVELLHHVFALVFMEVEVLLRFILHAFPAVLQS